MTKIWGLPHPGTMTTPNYHLAKWLSRLLAWSLVSMGCTASMLKKETLTTVMSYRYQNPINPRADSKFVPSPWWWHEMETFSELLALCAVNEFPTQRPVIYARINRWVNNHETGDLKRHRIHYNINVMQWETVLLCNDISHWLCASLESALKSITLFILLLCL